MKRKTAFAFFCLVGTLALIQPIKGAAEPHPTETPNETTPSIKVVRTLTQTDTDEPEFCLELSAAPDKRVLKQISDSLRLNQAGQNVVLPRSLISLQEQQLCIAGLSYRTPYQLSLTLPENSSGRYVTNFTIPDRPASLNFITTTNVGPFSLASSLPALRGINVKNARIEVYGFDEDDNIAYAWLNRTQPALAPSESLYYAQTKGHKIWSGQIQFSSTPNRQADAALPDNFKLAGPLALIVATTETTDTPATQNGLPPMAARWLINKRAKILARRRDNTLYFADTPDTSLSVWAQDLEKISTTTVNTSGTATIDINPKSETGFVVARQKNGDIGFADITSIETLSSAGNDYGALIQTSAKTAYPGELLTIRLKLNDRISAKAQEHHTTLRLVRSDGRIISERTLTIPSETVAETNLPLPEKQGQYILQWMSVEKGGQAATLSSAPLTITTVMDQPSLSVHTNTTSIPEDNKLSLDIHSKTPDGKQAAYLAGKIMMQWVMPKSPLREFSDFVFAAAELPPTTPITLDRFLTNMAGEAFVDVVLPSPDLNSGMTAKIWAEPEFTSGTADAPQPVFINPSLPARIGVKALAPDAVFDENTNARFSVVALNASGQRIAIGNLSYIIYREGRSFEWVQTDGRWDYHPLQHLKRLARQSLSIKRDGETIIEWPVTAGQYRIDIMDDDDQILTQMRFRAGWNAAKEQLAKPQNLPLTAIRDKSGSIKISFVLPANDRAAIFTFGGGATHVHSFDGVKGRNSVTVPLPAQTYGPVLVTAVANTLDLSGTTTIGTEKEGGTGITPTPLLITAPQPNILFVKDRAVIPLRFEAKKSGAWTYSLVSDKGVLITPKSGTVVFAGEEEKQILLAISAAEAGDKTIKFTATSKDGVRLIKEWVVPVLTPDLELVSENMTTGINPDSEWSVPSMDNETKNFVALYGRYLPEKILSQLQKAYASHPADTETVAIKLEFLKLWAPLLQRMPWASHEAIQYMQRELKSQLVARQDDDGKFQDEFADSKTNIPTTALALMALSDDRDATHYKDARQWIEAKLDNNWFDEKERELRALMILALAKSDALDNTKLLYFSDTSPEKLLPPPAKAALALAFATKHMDDKTAYWADSFWKTVGDAPQPPQTLWYMAQNPAVPFEKIRPVLALSCTQKGNTLDGKDALYCLAAIAALNNREKSGKIELNGKAQDSGNGITAITYPAGRIKNKSSESIDIAWGTFKHTKPQGQPQVTRRILRMDGSDSTNLPLQANSVYVIVLEGATRDADGGNVPYFDHGGGAWQPLSCSLPMLLRTDIQQRWINTLGLSKTAGCSITGSSVQGFVVNSGREWRVAYLAKTAMGGRYTLGLSTTPAKIIEVNRQN